jgi:hypothetical protein
MRVTSLAVVCALLCCIAGGCAASIEDREARSREHLDQEDQYLSGAMEHLQAARQRLGGQADPEKAGDELAAGASQVAQARGMQSLIRGDVSQLGGTAAALRKEIDSHRDDLLGPRGKRIRNRIVVLAVVAMIGWGLLRLGPVFGGPVGGGVIVLWHLLTAFAVPLVRLLGIVLSEIWKGAVLAGQWVAGRLEKLANAKAGGGTQGAAAAGASGKV